MVKRYDCHWEYGMNIDGDGCWVSYDDYGALEASMTGIISGVQLELEDERKKRLAAEARIAELESRLEVDPAHHVDGIGARNATIELQDAALDELKARVAELEKDAARYRCMLNALME